VPRPGSLLRWMNPLCCLTMPYTIASPSPVPLPASFVVKNGSKTRSCVFSSIPMPVSDTVRTPKEPALRWGRHRTKSSERTAAAVSIVSRPPAGIASRALMTRFMITCSIYPGSAWIAGSSPASDSRISTCSPATFDSTLNRSLTMSLRLTLERETSWRRE